MWLGGCCKVLPISCKLLSVNRLRIELLQQLGHKIRIEEAGGIRASYVRKQKTDRRDADHIPKLLG